MISPTARAAVHRLWDELADLDRADGDAALNHLLSSLAALAHAQNAWWLGSVRVGAEDTGDPLGNWRPRAIHYLAESANDRAWYNKAQSQLAAGSIDESVVGNARGAGTFRVNWLPEIVSPAWFKSPYYEIGYLERGVTDAVFVGCPVNDEAESFFGFHRKDPRRTQFSARDREVLGYALRGLRWFQRQLLLNHGLLLAQHPLTRTERQVLRHLLTEKAEAEIGETLGLARATTHNHITSIFRKFGVNSRAALMALWLGRG